MRVQSVLFGVAVALLVTTAASAQAKPATTKKRAGLTSTDTKRAKAILERLFAERDLAERPAILKELEPLDHPSKRDIQALTKFCFKLARKGPKQKGKNAVTCTHPDYPGQYILRATNKARRRKTGLFIALHGGGEGVGSGEQIEKSFGKMSGSFINVYPTVIKKEGSAWNREREERYVLAIIEELKRTYKIDTNRIYIAGHSMGGFGTWSIAGRHADLFAAASAMAGGTYGPGVIPNYKNLPLWFYHSTDDPKVGARSDIAAAERLGKLKQRYGAFDFVWKLYDDVGHGFPRDSVRPIFKWMMTKKRSPYPEHVLWERSRSYKTHFYWLKQARGRRLVEARRQGNVITVSGETRGLWLYLNDEMVKLKEPITVRSGDTVLLKRVIPYSLVALADSVVTRKDPAMYFTARVEVKESRR